MEASTIKFKTIQFINETKYLSEKQVEDLCYVMCHNLGIEKIEDNFIHVRDACKIYFDLQVNTTIIKKANLNMDEKKLKLITALEEEKKRLDKFGSDTEDHDITINFLKTGIHDCDISVIEDNYPLLDAALNDYNCLLKDYNCF